MYSNLVIEFRFRKYPDSTPWEEIGVGMRLTIDRIASPAPGIEVTPGNLVANEPATQWLTDFLRSLTASDRDLQVRWNFQGSLQGHYYARAVARKE